MPKIIFLWTDIAIFALFFATLVYAWHVSRSRNLRATWSRVARSAPAMCSAVVLSVFVVIGLLDSMHFQPRLPPVAGAPANAAPVYAPKVVSVLDVLLEDTAFVRPEKTYSAPLAWLQFTKESVLQEGGTPTRDFPRLRFGGRHLVDPAQEWGSDVMRRAGLGLLAGLLVALLLSGLTVLCVGQGARTEVLRQIVQGETELPWRAMLSTVFVLCLLLGVVFGLATGYHVLGTDRTGNDVLWQALKSIRTAWIIGSLTTVAMLPPALVLGISAGYFKGWIDDVIQYVYTTLTSIPGVLLIAACVLMMQVYIDTHPGLFPTAAQRADLRLFLLCMILGLTGWAGLCRLLRAEALKLRELEYVQAARAFGISNWRIMARHLLPNLMHIVLITVVLEFSGLVLYEAVLSYLGIGVDPSMNSFGSMIEKSRFEMSRDPMIWWNLLAAFIFMLALVLAANLFADAVRDAFDPRSRMFRPRRFNLFNGNSATQTGVAVSNASSSRGQPAETAILKVQELDVVIDTGEAWRHAVQALALTVHRGETFALVGESGSGKSMTALALMRLLPEALRVTQGSVVLGGVDINTLSESSMRTVRGGRAGMIFQEPGTSLNPVLRVGDQLCEAIVTHTDLRGAAARSRAVQWLQRVGIPEPERRIDDYPFQFSGGQKQRIMIAIALAAEPELLIADEPTTALDVTVQAQVLSLIRDIQQEFGMAVLLITHDLAVVRDVADTVALMRDGEIVETAPADQFFNTPKHPYARELFAAIPTFAKRGQPLSSSVTEVGIHRALIMGADARADDASVKSSANLTRQAPALVVEQLEIGYPIRKGLLRRQVGMNQAVQGVSFSLQRGETLALVGASGCGKTTVARALLRLIDSSAVISGVARLGDQDLLTASRTEMKALRRRIQIVFQDPFASLDPRMRVREILQEGIAALRPEWNVAEQSQRISALLARVGLPSDAGDRYPHEFSGGQRQRIAIARALAVEPEVLILDEPTSALDVSVQAQILDLLTDLQKETGMAYLFITHNFGVVEYLADRVAVMEAGRVVEFGDASQVLQAPKSAVTQELLAAVPRLG
jgi:ABC-type microcin C transport system duplicated ATPase subunit YejF/ABC-type dipeptide/oligopeptide/nickel transport system permease subunit